MSTEDEIIFREEWQEKARCRGMAHEHPRGSRHWFPERGEKSVKRRFPAAELCDECPVMYECLDFALRNRESEGIWGGTTGRDRKKMRKKLTAEKKSGEFEKELKSLIDDVLLDAL